MSDHAAIKCTAVVSALHVEELLLVASVDEYPWPALRGDRDADASYTLGTSGDCP